MDSEVDDRTHAGSGVAHYEGETCEDSAAIFRGTCRARVR